MGGRYVAPVDVGGDGFFGKHAVVAALERSQIGHGLAQYGSDGTVALAALAVARRAVRRVQLSARARVDGFRRASAEQRSGDEGEDPQGRGASGRHQALRPAAEEPSRSSENTTWRGSSGSVRVLNPR